MDSVAHPETVWAQRNDKLFLTIRLDDCNSPQIKIEEDSFQFSGKGGKEQKNYEIKFKFYGAVDPNESKQHLTARELTFVIKKKEIGPYWPRLQEATKKPPFLHTDFSKWRDEDDSDEEDNDKGFDEANFENMMANMGGGGGGGSSEKFDPGEVDDVDSDDEELPDLQE